MAMNEEPTSVPVSVTDRLVRWLTGGAYRLFALHALLFVGSCLFGLIEVDQPRDLFRGMGPLAIVIFCAVLGRRLITDVNDQVRRARVYWTYGGFWLKVPPMLLLLFMLLLVATDHRFSAADSDFFIGFGILGMFSFVAGLLCDMAAADMFTWLGNRLDK